MATTKIVSAKFSFSNRVRFNWGFHDAVSDVTMGRYPLWKRSHFDAAYAAGYEKGRDFAKQARETATSDAAWAEYRMEAR